MRGHFHRTTAGTPSSPHAIVGKVFSLEMISEPMSEVIWIPFSRDSFLGGNVKNVFFNRLKLFFKVILPDKELELIPSDVRIISFKYFNKIY